MAATTAVTTTTVTLAAVVAKATVMVNATASGRHGESSSVLAAGVRMETSDKLRGEPVDCCLCLCLLPSRCRHRVAAVAIAGTTMRDNVVRPTKEGHLGSVGLLPGIPFFKLQEGERPSY